MGRCQPGQFKGRSLRGVRRGQPVVTQTTRTVMSAPSGTCDVIVVGGGISGGWKNARLLLFFYVVPFFFARRRRGRAWVFFFFFCADLERDGGRAVPASNC